METKPVIRSAMPQEIPAIVDFVLAARNTMFSRVPASLHIPKVQAELAKFQEDYLEDREGGFLIAKSNGQIIATVGYVAYDNRFPQLDFGSERVVEVVKLYVDPKWRRAGLATKIFAALQREARQAGIRRLYLHTHPFLPGSVRFWERQGFQLECVDKDPIWQTTHMSKVLRRDTD
ncbi:putative GNAT family acetyltransferase [Emericellopsis atlantica]|uniref:GNAT family acetyltransferase n=1 Tax=Emericellopsis atlantica TaxID=2614577 RepID=A0A9P7ZMD0_9HYPO|nr:putative GNAT family acetyltransferase [Emericellopsis atlantica]KAG9254784.1 putative GNAT family acetyltransferase [Emericellopsis atlantica]